jgi:hypothetical protein
MDIAHALDTETRRTSALMKSPIAKGLVLAVGMAVGAARAGEVDKSGYTQKVVGYANGKPLTITVNTKPGGGGVPGGPSHQPGGGQQGGVQHGAGGSGQHTGGGGQSHGGNAGGGGYSGHSGGNSGGQNGHASWHPGGSWNGQGGGHNDGNGRRPAVCMGPSSQYHGPCRTNASCGISYGSWADAGYGYYGVSPYSYSGVPYQGNHWQPSLPVVRCGPPITSFVHPFPGAAAAGYANIPRYAP